MNRRVAEADLHRVLREELEARKWGVRDLSAKLGVQYGVASRWVSKDPRTRVVPVPTTLLEIADLFDLNVFDVFQHAGYLPTVEPDSNPNRDEIDRLIRRFRRTIRGIPASEWPLASEVIGLQLDQLQAILDRLSEHFHRDSP